WPTKPGLERCHVEILSAPGLLVRMARLMSVSSGVALNQPFLTSVPKLTFRLLLWTDVASPSEERACCGAALDRVRLAIGCRRTGFPAPYSRRAATTAVEHCSRSGAAGLPRRWGRVDDGPC